MADDLLSIAAIVSRDDLRTVIDHAINVTGDHFTRPEREWLRKVAGTCNQFAYAAWTIDGVDCPVLQSGVSRGYSGAELFSQHFDSAMHDLLRELHYDATNPQVVTVA